MPSPPFAPSRWPVGSENWNWKFAEKGEATLYWVGVHAAPAGEGSPVTTVLSVRRSVPLGERICDVPTRSSELSGMTSALAGTAIARARILTTDMKRI